MTGMESAAILLTESVQSMQRANGYLMNAGESLDGKKAEEGWQDELTKAERKAIREQRAAIRDIRSQLGTAIANCRQMSASLYRRNAQREI